MSKLYQIVYIVCTVGYYVTKTSANSSAVYWSRVSRDNDISAGCLICIVQNLRFSGFSLYPLYFSFTVPLNDPSFIEWHIRFTTVPFYVYLSNNEEEIIVYLNFISVRQKTMNKRYLLSLHSTVPLIRF